MVVRAGRPGLPAIATATIDPTARDAGAAGLRLRLASITTQIPAATSGRPAVSRR